MCKTFWIPVTRGTFAPSLNVSPALSVFVTNFALVHFNENTEWKDQVWMSLIYCSLRFHQNHFCGALVSLVVCRREQGGAESKFLWIGRALILHLLCLGSSSHFQSPSAAGIGCWIIPVSR